MDQGARCRVHNWVAGLTISVHSAGCRFHGWGSRLASMAQGRLQGAGLGCRVGVQGAGYL
jgi:hypothetical protein